jgi:DNA-binding XRE family transcriptional regulator
MKIEAGIYVNHHEIFLGFFDTGEEARQVRVSAMRDRKTAKSKNLIAIKRVEAGLTQKELSQKTGISVCTIRSWENGTRKPKIEGLRKICDVLGVDVEFFEEK